MKAKEILIILLLISALAFTEWNRLKINRLEARIEILFGFVDTIIDTLGVVAGALN